MTEPKKGDVVVIIPAYNEAETIEALVRRVQPHADVCVVNDCSKDDTLKILQGIEGIHIIDHEKNTHIPGAILDGMRYALQAGYAYAITMDAGLSHNPDELPRFLAQAPSDLVLSQRTQKINTPFFRRALSAVGNLIYNISLDFPKSLFKRRYYPDVTSGYRRYSRAAMETLVARPMRSRSFDFLFESMMRIYRQGLTISHVPISYDFSNSSLNGRVVRDCIKMCLGVIIQPSKG